MYQSNFYFDFRFFYLLEPSNSCKQLIAISKRERGALRESVNDKIKQLSIDSIIWYSKVGNSSNFMYVSSSLYEYVLTDVS